MRDLLLPARSLCGVVGAGGSDGAAAPNGFVVRNAALRQQETVLRFLVMRTKTYAFTWWALGSGVSREDIIEAAQALLDRVIATRLTMLYPRALAVLV